MATKIMLAKQFGALRPADEDSEEFLSHLRNGETVSAVITVPRARVLAHHNKLMALLGLVAQNHPTYTDIKTVLFNVKLDLGYADWVQRPDGTMAPMVRSISFPKMSQAEFDVFFDRVVKLIITRFLPGVGRAELDREVNEILLGRNAA